MIPSQKATAKTFPPVYGDADDQVHQSATDPLPHTGAWNDPDEQSHSALPLHTQNSNSDVDDLMHEPPPLDSMDQGDEP